MVVVIKFNEASKRVSELISMGYNERIDEELFDSALVSICMASYHLENEEYELVEEYSNKAIEIVQQAMTY